MSRSTRAALSCSLIVLQCAIAMSLVGCRGLEAVNPSFPIKDQQAHKLLAEMRASPRLATRPVLVLGGYLDTPLMVERMAERYTEPLSPDAPVTAVSFFGLNTFDACRACVIEAVDRAFGASTSDPLDTIEVDVIGYSLGGLVARYAAIPIEGEKRLKIARLFTLAAPHRGAKITRWLSPTETSHEMRPGSALLSILDAELDRIEYEIIPYVLLSDEVVGEWHAAPPGQGPIWAGSLLLRGSHRQIMFDARVIADVCRRLRGEKPLATEPRAPLPRSPREAHIQ